ncbi:MAG: alcohol dehydrogenase catalytic domain-containing protein [Planctomycetes bacterium]|nr:alcohol dehydrogenase catalytic domain-containing protein [Planctomycetota bacterium]
MAKAVECISPGKLHLIDYPTPDPVKDNILLKVIRSGVCGTDLQGIEGRRSLRYPVIPGHEIVAVVDKIGDQAHRHIKALGGNRLNEGDRVTINPRIVCGDCFYCQNLPQRQEMCLNAKTYGSSLQSNKHPHLFGGWAENLYILPGSEIIKLPEGLSDDLAVLSEPFACAVGLVDRFRREHDWITGDGFRVNCCVIIYGAGTIGILMASAFSLAGAEKIVMLDLIEKRLSLSKEFGVSHIINTSVTPDCIGYVKELTEGIGADIVIEACGVPKVLKEGIKLLRRGGILFEVGHLADVGMAEIDPHLICRNEIEILGHYAYPSSQNLAYAARLLAEHTFPYEKLIHKIPLDDYATILDRNVRRNIVKIIFEM